MPPSSTAYHLPSDAPPSVLREEDIESGFIGTLQGLKYTYRPEITNRATLEQNFREKSEAQSSGARKTAKGSPQGERRGVHQFHTPSCVVRLLVEMLTPYTGLRGSAFLQSEASPQVASSAKDNGRIYDPACGSGGVAKCEVRSASVEVKKSRPFVIRNSSFGISLGPEHADTLRRAQHPELSRN